MRRGRLPGAVNSGSRFVRLAGCLPALVTATVLAQAQAVPVGMIGLPDFAALRAREMPVVVTIRTTVAAHRPGNGPALPAGPHAGGGGTTSRPSFAVGSGFIISRSGYILTNAHLIAGTDEAEVRLADGRMYIARIAGQDAQTDVALLAVDADDLPVADLAEGPHVGAGDWVSAVGAPLGLERSMTVGIVSAWPRYLEGLDTLPLIQTQVPIHAGSSGSPLFNLRGQVVGMNSAIYTPDGSYAGVGFAIPIESALRISMPWRSDRKEPGAQRPYVRGRLGLLVQPLSPELARAFGWRGSGGALIHDVLEGSPAALAGLQAGDIVVGVGDREAADLDELQAQIAKASAGTSMTVSVFRHGAVAQVTLRADAQARPPPEPGVLAVLQEEHLGLSLVELTPARRNGTPLASGLLVRAVSGTAQRAGLLPDDVIVAVGDRPVRTLAEFETAANGRAGRPIACLVWREGTYGYLPLPSR